MTRSSNRARILRLALSLSLLAGCESPSSPLVEPTAEAPPPSSLPVLGLGVVANRYTSEVAVLGEVAYTGTWGAGHGRALGNMLNVWDVSGSSPVLRDSLALDEATTLGDVQVSVEDSILVVATEYSPGSIVIFDVRTPTAPRQIARFSSPSTEPGVHTAKLARVDGVLYAFLSVDPSPPRLVVVDLSDPANPREVLAREMGEPYIHDAFVRDGFLLTALWDGGVALWDIGGGGRGTLADPVRVSDLVTAGGHAHNVWWAGTASSVISGRYVFVGEERHGEIGIDSGGDIHVVDISNPASPREVAFFNVAGAGTHNFAVDEASGVLFAAYYNGGVRALDVRGELGACGPEHRDELGRCDLARMGREVGRGLLDHDRSVYVWGVQWVNGVVYASDMLNGLFKIDATTLRR